ncbi:MAG TPA: GNAT family N-acetyltransferase [Mycobacteriales bacterium]|nr:GNAT family N-acetyltransferase [Mycobacteriales bacterium]
MTVDGDYVIEPADGASDEAITLIQAYLAEINAGFGHQPDERDPNHPEDFNPPTGRFLVVRDSDGRALGCCAVRLLDADTAEVKRMWLAPEIRGRGMGRRLLAAIEQAARDLGARQGKLDTNESLTAAVSLYQRCGWAQVPRYNDNLHATHWFTKDLLG